MRKLLSIFFLVTVAAFSQAALTPITGPLYAADGTTPFSGTLHISWPAYSIGQNQYPAASMDVLVDNGVLNIRLVPSTIKTPVQPYQILYTFANQPVFQQWYVPSSTSTIPLTAVTAIKSSSGGGWVCKLASALGFLLNNTDETSLLNSTIAAIINGGGGCLAVDAGKTLRADGQVVTPYNVSASMRLTSSCGTGANAYGTPIENGCGVLDLRYHAGGTNCSAGVNCGPKIFTNFSGSFEVDHITLTTNFGPADCAAFLLTTVSSLYVHDMTIYGGHGSFPAVGCNDGIILGGDSSVYDSATTAPFIGYGSVIRFAKFMGLARAWKLGNASNGTVFDSNSIGGGNGTTPVDEMVLIQGNARANQFVNNLMEFWDGGQPTHHITYQCGFKIFDGQHNSFRGNQFWDGDGTTRPFCAGNSLAVQNMIDKSNFVDGGTGPLTNTTWPADNYMPYRSVSFFFDGGGAPLTAITRCTPIRIGGQIVQFTMSADQTSTGKITVKAVSSATYTGPGSAADISNGGEQLTSGVFLQDNTLTSWNTIIAPNTMVCFALSSPSGMTWAAGNIQIWEGR